MTDKVQKIREEVEKLKLCTMDEHMKFYSESAEAEYYALCKVEEIIDSMQEEPVNEDLEKELARWMNEHFNKDMSRYSGRYLTNNSLLEFARHFVDWQKRQMMKDAIPAKIESSPDPHGADYGNQKMEFEYGVLESKGIISGTLVKNLIIKED